MKTKIYSLRSFLFLIFATASLSFTSCEKDTSPIQEDKSANFITDATDASPSSQRYRWPYGFTISVEANLISADKGCYTVQINIFITDKEAKWLAATGTAQIGDCDPEVQQQENSTNPNCDDKKYKGDYIITDKDSKNCLIDYLQDEKVYKNYVMARDKAISQVKK